MDIRVSFVFSSCELHRGNSPNYFNLPGVAYCRLLALGPFMNEMPSSLSTSSHSLSTERLDSNKFQSSAKLTNLKLKRSKQPVIVK